MGSRTPLYQLPGSTGYVRPNTIKVNSTTLNKADSVWTDYMAGINLENKNQSLAKPTPKVNVPTIRAKTAAPKVVPKQSVVAGPIDPQTGKPLPPVVPLGASPEGLVGSGGAWDNYNQLQNMQKPVGIMGDNVSESTFANGLGASGVYEPGMYGLQNNPIDSSVLPNNTPSMYSANEGFGLAGDTPTTKGIWDNGLAGVLQNKDLMSGITGGMSALSTGFDVYDKLWGGTAKAQKAQTDLLNQQRTYNQMAMDEHKAFKTGLANSGLTAKV